MSAERQPMASVGRVVDRYVLHDEIAAGGMATVHLGRLIGPAGFARTVAVKRLHAHVARDQEFVSMFLDEARLAGRRAFGTDLNPIAIRLAALMGLHVVYVFTHDSIALGEDAQRCGQLFFHQTTHREQFATEVFEFGIELARDVLGEMQGIHDVL